MKRIVMAVVSLLVMAGAWAQTVANLQSPDGRAKVTVSRGADGMPQFVLNVDGTQVLNESRMGYRSGDDLVAGQAWTLGQVKKSSHKGVWKPIWGKRKEVKDVYNSIQLNFVNTQQQNVILELRAYNDGMAWHYTNHRGEAVWNEVSDLNFAGDYTAWYYNGERHNIGPEPLTRAQGERTPIMTIQVKQDLYLAVHEACLYQGKPLLLRSEAGSTRFNVVSEDTRMKEDAEAAVAISAASTILF